MTATITLFANLTNPTTPELDANFIAYAVFGNIPCSVSGQNALVLTQASNTPNLTQLTNYIRFSGVFAQTNNGAVTVQAAGFPVLNGYKDGPGGPTAFVGGECITGNAFTATYDSTLNSGAGGYHVGTSTAFSGGTITGNLVASGSTISVIGGSLGVSLTSTLLTGNSLSITAQNINAQTLSISSLASVVKFMVGASASSLTRMISGTGTLTYTVTPANQVQDQTFTIPGVQIGDTMAMGLPQSIPAGAGFTGFIPAAGSVTLRLVNPTAATLGAATLTVRANAMGFT